MAVVDISILGKPYSIACDTGQEKHLKELAVYLDRKLRAVASGYSAASSPSEMHMLVVTALLIADELNDTSLEIAELRAMLESSALPSAAKPADEAASLTAYQKSIEQVAEKIEALAEELEKA